MKSKIQKWGNSSGIRLPKIYLDALKIKCGDTVDIRVSGENLLITKEKKSLQERIDAYDGPNMVDCFAWDDPVGKEIW